MVVAVKDSPEVREQGEGRVEGEEGEVSLS